MKFRRSRAGAAEVVAEDSDVAESEFPANSVLSQTDENEESGDVSATDSDLSASILRQRLIASLVVVLALAGLTGWLGLRAYQSHRTQVADGQYLQVARQGAVNLTTIDWQHADADIQRILDGATGSFYDDFSKRSKPFVDVVKQAKSISVGTVASAGLESVTEDAARVLVAMNVRTTNAGTEDPRPRSWRMRVDVQKVGSDMKVSNVEFVP